MSRRPDPRLPPARHEVGTEPACDVFYLRTEPHLGGYRWLVAKSGSPEPVAVGTSVFPSDHAAKLSGRAGLDRFLAHQNSWSRAPRRV